MTTTTTTTRASKRIAAAANAAETGKVGRTKKKVKQSSVTRAATLAPPTKLTPIQGTSSDDASYDSSTPPSNDVLDGLRLADIPVTSVLEAVKKLAHVPPLPTNSGTASLNPPPSNDVLDGLRLAEIPVTSVLEAGKKPAHVPLLPTNSGTASLNPPMATNSVSAIVPPPMDFVVKFLPPKSIFLSGMLNSYGKMPDVDVSYFSHISCCAYDSIVVRLCLFVSIFVCYKSCCLGLNTNCYWFILN